MSGTLRRYFARGHTARGHFTWLPSILKEAVGIWVLQGPPGVGKSTFLSKLAERFVQEGLDVECFHSPLYPEELEAVFVPRLKAAVLSDELCPLTEEASFVAEYFPMDGNAAADAAEAGADENRDEIAACRTGLEEAYSQAFRAFAEALAIHDEWESYYISNMDKSKADETARELSQRILGNGGQKEKRAVVRHLFFGAATPAGAVDHIPNLTAGLATRIFLKGRAGTGKSTLLKRLAADAEKMGYDTDVFHCGFDPGSVDMLIFPELGITIFDSTLPHEYFPERAGDEILDLYERLIAPGVDERFRKELDDVKGRYSAKMKEATAYLAAAWKLDSRIRELQSSGRPFSWTEQHELACRNLAERILLK